MSIWKSFQNGIIDRGRNMKRTLIVATTSYAGMGPYVSEIVNTFSPEDDVYFFFHDYEDDFFKRNIKKELHPQIRNL